MAKHNTSRRGGLRIPPEVGGIQINFCKNPLCENFGVPAKEHGISANTGARKVAGDGYKIIGSGGGVKDFPVLLCKKCREVPAIKSNLAISEELGRMLKYLEPRHICCPNSQCSNSTIPVSIKGHYQKFGKTKRASIRYRCKSCDKTFSVPTKTGLRQRQSHKNRQIYAWLLNHTRLRRVCKVLEIAPKTLYARIEFFYQQSLAFAGNRERKLLEGMKLERLYIAVDRQDYIINWTNQADRRNVQLHAVASADTDSGYVFGMHLDFDPTMDRDAVEADALLEGDPQKTHAYRKYARLWLSGDYNDALRIAWRLRKKQKALSSKKSVQTVRVVNDVAETYSLTEARDDVEVAPTQDFDTSLPKRGMQIHSEYTLYAHFQFLERMLRGVEKVRFFLDQESGIRAASLSAFKERIRNRTADMFYVRINKDLTINERRSAIANSRKEFKKAMSNNPGMTYKEIEVLLLQQRISASAAVGKWSDRWVLHPFPSASEPEKAMCYLTDMGDYQPDHLAHLYSKVSLHAIDRYFMQIRRGISLLDRPIQSASSARRLWNQCSPYNPEGVTKILEIYRVYYNYVQCGEDGKTPAMRLGLARAPIAIEDLLSYCK